MCPSPIPILLDTDIGTDVDDAIALAVILAAPELDVRAVTTVSGGVVRRGHIARKLQPRVRPPRGHSVSR